MHAPFDQTRDVWLPDWDISLIEINGQEWPNILVEKWERNGIGERRFVVGAVYEAPTWAADLNRK